MKWFPALQCFKPVLSLQKQAEPSATQDAVLQNFLLSLCTSGFGERQGKAPQALAAPAARGRALSLGVRKERLEGRNGATTGRDGFIHPTTCSSCSAVSFPKVKLTAAGDARTSSWSGADDGCGH